MPPPSLVGGSVTILRARTQTRIEMAASMRLAEALVGDAVDLVHQQLPAEQFLAVLPAQLRSLRHVRIAVKDAAGIPIAAAPSAVAAVGRGSAGGRGSDDAPGTALVRGPGRAADRDACRAGRLPTAAASAKWRLPASRPTKSPRPGKRRRDRRRGPAP